MKVYDYDYKIGDNIKDDIRDLTIVDKKFFEQSNRKSWYYKYHCNKCGYECEDGYRNGVLVKARWFSRQQLKSGGKNGETNCACCTSRIVVPNINSIKMTNPELISYFINGDEEKYTIFSGKKITMKCPFCGTFKDNMIISRLPRAGLSCPVCSKHMSIGERMMYTLLSQLNIHFIKEFVFDNSKYRFDFYLPDLSTIIEINGEQHYIDSSKFFRSNQSEIDQNKKDMALQNGIRNYIEINARQSSYEYIKSSIQNSDLCEIIDISLADWDSIHKNLYTKNIVKEVCDFWEHQEHPDYVELENKFHLSESTLRKYIKLGVSVGWCHNKEYYNPAHKHISSKNKTKPLLYDNSVYFKSVRLCSENSDILMGKHYPDSTIRYKLKRHDSKFEEITKQEFNMAFEQGKQCYGTPFVI